MKAALKCSKLKLYFAVPENMYASFEKQPYLHKRAKSGKEM